MKKKIALVLTLMLLVTGGIIYAQSPNEVITDLTGLSYDEIYAMHSAGMTVGDIAEEYDVFDEFHAAMLSEKEAILNTWVAEGKITAEQAESIITQLENCDATGSQQGLMRSFGLGIGFGNGSGNGYGLRDGSGLENGSGLQNGGGFRNGNGLRDGSGYGNRNQ